MHVLRGIGFVEKIDSHWLAFSQTNRRARRRAVISDGADGMVLRDIRQHCSNSQRDIGRPAGATAASRPPFLQPASSKPLPAAMPDRKPRRVPIGVFIFFETSFVRR